jgi:hypothetical protein
MIHQHHERCAGMHNCDCQHGIRSRYQSLSRLAGYEAGFDSSTIMISIGAFSAFEVPVTVNLVSKFDAPNKALMALFDEANGTP